MNSPDIPSRPEEFIGYDLAFLKDSEKRKKYWRFIATALGAIPWIGTAISLGAMKSSVEGQDKTNELYEEWLRVHKEKLRILFESLEQIAERLDQVHEDLKERIESDSYLSLVRRAFRSWDNAETREKRQYIINLISNAAATSMCPDDMVRLFNDWLDTYHEAHFKVIREIYKRKTKKCSIFYFGVRIRKFKAIRSHTARLTICSLYYERSNN